MIRDVHIPQLGITMDQAIVVEWSVQDGQEVQEGDLLVIIETDKAAHEIIAPAGGFVRIIQPPGSVVPMGGVIGFIATTWEEYENAPIAPIVPAAPERDMSYYSSTAAKQAKSTSTDLFYKVSGVARKLAEKHGLDLSRIIGTGLGGRITKKDVEKALNQTHFSLPEFPKEFNNIKDLVDIFKLILDNVYSGILFCDNECRIIFMNQVFAELLRTDRDEAVGKHIKKYFPKSRLPKVLESGFTELGEPCSMKFDPPLLVNRIPIKREGETVGVILQSIFRDFIKFKDLVARLNLLERKVKFYKKSLDSILSAQYTFDSIIGQSESILKAKKISEKYANTDAAVLILGLTGTGKELFAHAIHMASPRKCGPFVCVNCAAIPKELIESELFGYESGAFTGARQKGKAGKIELAHGGTLFLDEIGDLPLNAQAKLLRALETKMLDRLGGLTSVEVDFRLVAATNKDLKDMIRRQEFREELFYRLNTMTVCIPPLSERVDDIPILINHVLKSMGKQTVRVTESTMQILQSYSWPGNVRELKNVVEQAVSLADENMIDLENLPLEIVRFKTQEGRPPRSNNLLSEELDLFEKNLLAQTIRLTKGNMAKTSKLLGISRSTLYEKCKRHNLSKL